MSAKYLFFVLLFGVISITSFAQSLESKFASSNKFVASDELIGQWLLVETQAIEEGNVLITRKNDNGIENKDGTKIGLVFKRPGRVPGWSLPYSFERLNWTKWESGHERLLYTGNATSYITDNEWVSASYAFRVGDNVMTFPETVISDASRLDYVGLESSCRMIISEKQIICQLKIEGDGVPTPVAGYLLFKKLIE